MNISPSLHRVISIVVVLQGIYLLTLGFLFTGWQSTFSRFDGVPLNYGLIGGMWIVLIVVLVAILFSAGTLWHLKLLEGFSKPVRRFALLVTAVFNIILFVYSLVGVFADQYAASTVKWLLIVLCIVAAGVATICIRKLGHIDTAS